MTTIKQRRLPHLHPPRTSVAIPYFILLLTEFYSAKADDPLGLGGIVSGIDSVVSGVNGVVTSVLSGVIPSYVVLAVSKTLYIFHV